MERMISLDSEFQSSVNIKYDLHNDEKLMGFIPTKGSLTLLEEILLSTRANATDRARILIGPYGKGKSHIVLMILSILLKRDLNLFRKALKAFKENKNLYQCIENYYSNNEKFLPVVISGSNMSLSQAFILALQKTLEENELGDVMPETNYKAAVKVIERWKVDFPDTYSKLQDNIDLPIDILIDKLGDYNTAAYETFQNVYPLLTSGSVFNPFMGFDVAELYESVLKSLKEKGYTGIYVIYDEFSKFLEADVNKTSISDTKMLQDFAEKCARSANSQMHIMLISHKEIASYISGVSKEKVDGWRGVSERFKHVILNNNFSQTYEIIAAVINKNKKKWEAFCDSHKEKIDGLVYRYANHNLFNDVDDVADVVYSCYPLHPVSTFVLPRLSERVAQNERTLFTFLSAREVSSLYECLKDFDEKSFYIVTPDKIYDYFEPLLKKEIYTSEIYKTFQLTSKILDRIETDGLEKKIIKTISIIYILGQFEKLKPTKEELLGIYSIDYTIKDIETAIDNLIKRDLVIYLKRSNNYIKLKETSGVDVVKEIMDVANKAVGKVSLKEILNDVNFDSYIYPSRYNDSIEMTRYFAFKFINESDFYLENSEGLNGADGVIYAIIPDDSESLDELKTKIQTLSEGKNLSVFVVPKKAKDISDIALEFYAVSQLKEAAQDDKVLQEEYQVIYEDLHDILRDYVSNYTHPEKYNAWYIYNGVIKSITRKALLSACLSDICESVYYNTPIINNESINKNEITATANNSRNKVLAGLLRKDLEANLGLTGSGQEVSIMRSTLVRPGVLIENNGKCTINRHPNDEKMRNVLFKINNFVEKARDFGHVRFDELYDDLINPSNHIALRKGIIPIYIAAVLHEYQNEVVLTNEIGEIPLNADSLVQINATPSKYFLSCFAWSPEREEYIDRLSDSFGKNIVNEEKNSNSYDYIAHAMYRWYLGLPKYSKTSKTNVDGSKVIKTYTRTLQAIKENSGGNELLFESIPRIFNCNENELQNVAIQIANIKTFYDSRLVVLKNALYIKVKEIFGDKDSKASCISDVQDWCEKLDGKVFEQLFDNGTERCLKLFTSAGNNEEDFIIKLAKLVTGLRLEDWDDSIIEKFNTGLKVYKKTAEEFHSEVAVFSQDTNVSDAYQLSFIGERGETVTKRFNKVEYSARGKLLYNAITDNLESMGQAITEQEKRQILMEILKSIC